MGRIIAKGSKSASSRMFTVYMVDAEEGGYDAQFDARASISVTVELINLSEPRIKVTFLSERSTYGYGEHLDSRSVEVSTAGCTLNGKTINNILTPEDSLLFLSGAYPIIGTARYKAWGKKRGYGETKSGTGDAIATCTLSPAPHLLPTLYKNDGSKGFILPTYYDEQGNKKLIVDYYGYDQTGSRKQF